MKKVSIVILNWNRKKDTLDCLNSISKLQTPNNIKVEVVVVDNGSNDGSQKAIKGFSSIKLIENKENLGFAAGNNIGIEYALSGGADYVLILNNDTILDNKLLVHLMKVAGKKKVGIVSPKIYFAKGFEFHKERYKKADLGKVIWFAGGKVDWDNVQTIHIGVNDVDKGQYDTEKKVENANGACMLVKREVFEDIGNFDERYFAYWEETDFCYKANRAGWKIYYAPKAVIWHKVSATSEIGGKLHDYFLTRNKMLFGIMYAPFRTKLSLYKWSLKILLGGAKWQKIAIKDFYLGKFEQGSWEFK